MKSKKTGIITFHFSKNYGSALQCYALYTFLDSHGYRAQVIDYCPGYHTYAYHSFISFHDYAENSDCQNPIMVLIKTIMINGLVFLDFAKRNKIRRFDRFIKNNLDLSKPYKQVKDIEDSFDTYISGSDQIWNYKCVKDTEYGGVYDKAYFLSFASGKKKIAYAVSAQHGEIRTDLDADILSLINDYDHISTREEVLSNTLRTLGRADAVSVIDPTLLLDREFYERVEAKSMCRNDKYILVYNLPGANSELLKTIVQRIAEQTGYSVVDISPTPITGVKSKKMKSCGPAEFLSYVHHAETVLTDSFHAITFSLIYHKDFHCVLREENDERIKNILSLCGLTEKLVESIADEVNDTPIDYRMVEERMKPARDASVRFLLHALEK